MGLRKAAIGRLRDITWGSHRQGLQHTGVLADIGTSHGATIGRRRDIIWGRYRQGNMLIQPYT